jgi:hypothetical protein
MFAGFLKVCDQGFSGTGDVMERVLHTVVIYPSRNLSSIGSFSKIKHCRTVEILGGQKSLNPTKDECLPPNRIHVATVSSLRPQAALKIAYAKFCILPTLVGKRLAYGGPDHHRKHYQQMTYTLPHGRGLHPSEAGVRPPNNTRIRNPKKHVRPARDSVSRAIFRCGPNRRASRRTLVCLYGGQPLCYGRSLFPPSLVHLVARPVSRTSRRCVLVNRRHFVRAREARAAEAEVWRNRQ